MELYSLESSQETIDSSSPLHNFNQSNSFFITANTYELVHSYLTNPSNATVIGNTFETNALLWAQGEYVNICFELSDTLKSNLPQLGVTHEFRESTIVDRWRPKREGLWCFKVTRKRQTVYILLKLVTQSGRGKVSSGTTRAWGGQRRRGEKRSGRVGLVLDDTVNIKTHNK